MMSTRVHFFIIIEAIFNFKKIKEHNNTTRYVQLNNSKCFVHENGNKPIIIISIEAKEGGKLKSKLR